MHRIYTFVWYSYCWIRTWFLTWMILWQLDAKNKIYIDHNLTKSSFQSSSFDNLHKIYQFINTHLKTNTAGIAFFTLNASTNCTCSTTISLDHKIGIEFTIYTMYTHFKITSSTVSISSEKRISCDGNKIRILHNELTQPLIYEN